MNNSEVLHTKKIYLGKSRVHGHGIFAKKDIKRGERVFIIKGRHIHFVIRTKKDAFMGPHWIGLDKNLWIDPSPPASSPKHPYNPASYLNHSCNPNVGIKGSVMVVALRDIKKDEEFTFDYATTEESFFWEFDCTCGERTCRKKIHSIQFLPARTYKKYLPYVPRYFQNVYMSYNGHKNDR